MADLSTTNLISYVPALVARRMLQDPPLVAPARETLAGAILFADISGWTPLTERLSALGAAGIEELTTTLNTYFGALIDTIQHYGGEVVKFAGDALIALWEAADTDVAAVVWEAAACGQAIQQHLSQRQVIDATLTLKVVVAAGEIDILYLGGINNRLECVLTGEPLIQVSLAAFLANAGEVIVSPEAWSVIESHAQATHIRAGTMRLTAISEPVHRPAQPVEIAAPQIRQFIPRVVLNLADAQLDDWLAELRTISVLFISLPISHWTSLELSQAALTAVQTALQAVEGSINKVSIDEKGVIVVAALGLPPRAHEDDPTRAVQAGLMIQEALTALSLDFAIGITTGRAFCGIVGADVRREYTVIGDSVNAAARLMSHASKNILCDITTYEAARATIEFSILEPIPIKGKLEPFPIFRPDDFKQVAPIHASGMLVGREKELACFEIALERLKTDLSSTILLEGPGGIGKTRLAQALLEMASETTVLSVFGAANPHDLDALYGAWGAMLLGALNAENISQPEREAQVLAALDATELLPLASLLNELLALGLPDTERTRNLSGHFRAEQTRNVILAVLEHARQNRPLVMVFDDASWLDSASWSMLEHLLEQPIPCLILLTARTEPTTNLWNKLRTQSTTEHLRLMPLSHAEVGQLVGQTLRVERIQPAVIDLINVHAEGQPFWSREITIALRDKGVIEVIGHTCRLAEHAIEQGIEIPGTLQGVVTSRVDRLTPGQQLLLKAASVIGRTFLLTILHAIYPLPVPLQSLKEDIGVLNDLDITASQPLTHEPLFSFRHAITHDVIYNLLPYTQRQRLHRAVAEWYQSHADGAAKAGTLARHWQEAGNYPSAIECLEQAARYALHSGAYQEAANFLIEAMELSQNNQLALPPIQQARWKRLLSEASVGLGDIGKCREHLEEALRILGDPAPQSRSDFLRDLSRQILVQLRRRWLPGSQLAPPEQRELLLEKARISEQLWVSYHSANAAMEAWTLSWRMLNFAEAAGPSPTVAHAYAQMCFLSMLVPPAARFYEQAALKLLPLVVEPSERSRMLIPLGRYYAYTGDWKRAEALLNEAANLANQLGDQRVWEEILSDLGMAMFHQGRFTEGVRFGQQIIESASKRNTTLHLSLGWYVEALNMVPQGQITDAIKRLEQVVEHLKVHPITLYSVTSWGLLALAHWQQGDQAAADVAIDAVLAIAKTSAATDVVGFGFPGAAEVLLNRLLFNPPASPSERKTLEAQAKRLVKNMRLAQRLAPIFQPLAWRCRGMLALAQGKRDQAIQDWIHGLSQAQRLQMPHEAALIHQWLGRTLPTPEAELHQRLAACWFESR